MLKDRVAARLDELSITPSEAARRGGLERTFLIDILHERKRGVRGANLEKLARALECSPEYLTGRAAATGAPPTRNSTLPFTGIVADGVYRQPGAEPMPALDIPIYPDRRYQTGDMEAMRVSGACGRDYEIAQGSYLIVVPLATYREKYGGLRDGMIVVTEVSRDELVMTRLNKVFLTESGIALDRTDAPGETIKSVVVKAIKVFA